MGYSLVPGDEGGSKRCTPWGRAFGTASVQGVKVLRKVPNNRGGWQIARSRRSHGPLVPLGIHLANGSQGDLGADVLASTVVGLGVLLIGARSGVSAEGLLVAVPVGQILAAVAAEIMVSRRSRALPEP